MRTLILLPCFLLPAFLYSGESIQTDWSSGPGVTGPVTDWSDSFDLHQYMDYEGTTGELYLNLRGDKHLVTDYMEYSIPGVVADINGDGHPDILSGSNGYSKNRVYWFENDGTGENWQRHIVSKAGEVFCPRSVCAVDADNDGDLDVVGGEGSFNYDRKIYLWTNTDGSGLNWETSIIRGTLGNSPLQVIPADMDGDNDLDIIVKLGISEVLWYENPLQNMSGTTAVWGFHLVGEKEDCNQIFPADINGDGWLDVVNVAEGSNKQVSWWENLDGTGENWAERTIANNINYGQAVHAADMDVDGDLDVIAMGWDNLYWFENNDGLGTSWTNHQLPEVFSSGNAVFAVDVFGTGPPVILASYDLPARFVLWERTDEAGLTWRRHILEHGYLYYGLAVGDIDEDDTLDVVTFEDGSRIYWFGLGYPSTGTLTSSILDVNNYPHWQEVQWQDSVPAGSSLRFRVRSSNDPGDMGEWSGYIEEPGSLSGYVDSTHRYLQYRVHMEPAGRFVTPTLYQVLFYWEWLGVEGSAGGPVLHPVANPSFGTAEIRFSLPESVPVALAVYDMCGREVAVPVDGMISSGEHAVSVSSLPSGAYFVRMTAGDQVLRGSFVLVGNR